MPRLARVYPQRWFSAEIVSAAYRIFKRGAAGEVPEERRSRIRVGDEWRRFDEAGEFFAAYTSDADAAELRITYKTSSFLFAADETGTRVEVGLPSDTTAARVVHVFDAAATESDGRMSVFLGHGRDPAWTLLSDHLASQPDIRVRTYENSIAPGVTAIELLEQLGAEVAFAVLVHTSDAAPGKHGAEPSDNVVHETGFFQGALGRKRTLVVRERGCPAFHNIAGLHEVTFEHQGIEATFEPILHLIRWGLSRP